MRMQEERGAERRDRESTQRQRENESMSERSILSLSSTTAHLDAGGDKDKPFAH